MEQAHKLIGLWDKIKETAEKSRPGDCFRVPTSGSKLEKFRLE
jgi:hypothetical protein